MKGRGWLLGYGITAVVHLAAIATDRDLVRFVTKPMLMALLLAWFMTITAGLASSRYRIMSGLLFSWLGDVFLMIQGGSGFIAGLSSFLLAHACYIVFFLIVRRSSGASRKWNGYVLTAVLIYVTCFNYILLPSLDAALKIPVLLYSVVIGTMFIVVFHASSRSDFGHNVTIAGAVLFIISDSILAVNTFLEPLGSGDLLIMLTYILAQAFIVYGASIWLQTQHKS